MGSMDDVLVLSKLSCLVLYACTRKILCEAVNYLCSAQFANLRKFEIALLKLEIVKLQTNYEIAHQLQNCTATLGILEIAQEPVLIIGTSGISSFYAK